MDFKQIEAFVSVVKHRSFSKAADATFVTQPTISTHVLSLERELGVTLILRGAKEALPTPQGRIFYKYAAGMLATREKAAYSLGNYSREIGGVIEIQASSIPGQFLLPAIMADFRKEYPKTRFYLQQTDSARAAAAVLENREGLGFTGAPCVKGLKCIPLIEDEVVLITPASKKFIERKGRELSVEDFVDEPFIWREEGSGTRQSFADKLAALRYEMRDLDIAAKINSLDTIKQAVAKGLGISIISRMAAELPWEGGEPGYLVHSIRDFKQKRMFYMIHHKNAVLTPTVERFRDYVLEWFGGGE